MISAPTSSGVDPDRNCMVAPVEIVLLLKVPAAAGERRVNTGSTPTEPVIGAVLPDSERLAESARAPPNVIRYGLAKVPLPDTVTEPSWAFMPCKLLRAAAMPAGSLKPSVAAVVLGNDVALA